MEYKKCSKCKEDRHVSCFTKDKRNNDGFQSQCELCRKELKDRWKNKNREKYNASNRAYYQKIKDKHLQRTRDWKLRNRDWYLEQQREYAKQRYAENREEEIRKSLLYRQNNYEKYIAYQRRWSAENKNYFRQWREENNDKRREYLSRRRSKQSENSVGSVSYEKILQGWGFICHICNREIENRSDLHFDHVIPISKGGAHSEENIRPAHSRCNIRKGSKLVREVGVST